MEKILDWVRFMIDVYQISAVIEKYTYFFLYFLTRLMKSHLVPLFSIPIYQLTFKVFIIIASR